MPYEQSDEFVRMTMRESRYESLKKYRLHLLPRGVCRVYKSVDEKKYKCLRMAATNETKRMGGKFVTRVQKRNKDGTRDVAICRL